MNGQFVVGAGTVLGRQHQLSGRNAQDAFAWRSAPGWTAAIVCDGCSGGAHSEVGAQLGAPIFLHALGAQLDAGGANPVNGGEDLLAGLERARRATVAQLRRLARVMGPNRERALVDYFLFTVVGVAITESQTLIFSRGDGVYALNGEVVVQPPFPGNRPPYLADDLLSPPEHAATPRWQFQVSVPTSEVTSVLIASDGAARFASLVGQSIPGSREPIAPLSQFWENDHFVRHPYAIRRYLSRLTRASEDGEMLLDDDTTVLVVRRATEVST